MKHAYQTHCWLNEMDNDVLTPMVQIETGVFFIFEPSLLSDGRLIIPFRWFYREGRLSARVWPMFTERYNERFGWIVYEFEEFVIEASMLSITFPFLCEDYWH